MNRMELAGRILSLGSENKGCDKNTKADVLQTAMKLIREYEAQEQANGVNSENEKCTLPVVSNSYCGEQGEDNMKADIKEIMRACGDKFDFIRLCNEAQEELDEAAFDLDQESRMNGV